MLEQITYRDEFLANPPLQAIAYVSEVRRPMSMGEVDRLLVSSSAHNSLAAITGVLLYDGARFFQYFEGPPAGVQHTYDRIKRSSRHHVIAEVYNGSIVERYFPDWQMACRKVLPGSIVELSAQRWSRTRLALWSAGKNRSLSPGCWNSGRGPCRRQLIYDRGRVGGVPHR